MNHRIRNCRTLALICGLFAALAVLTPSLHAADHQFRLSDGSTWSGDKGDVVEVVFRKSGEEYRMTGTVVAVDGPAPNRLLVIQGEFAGLETKKPIFESSLVSIRTVVGGDEGDGSRDQTPESTGAANDRPRSDTTDSGEKRGVFLLPWEGMVGTGARHDELKEIGEEADKYGPGQTIVLYINSPGGLVSEGDDIHETLMDLKKRHRVVAWIKKAISAGAFTALHCDEIYFMKVGAMGSATMFAGETSISGRQLEAWLKDFGDVAEAGGRSRIPAECMITRTKMASYDKDPETGDVTWYADMTGEFPLCDGESMLSFNAENAIHSNYISGIADTEAELAELLDLPEWHEISDEGRRIHERWQGTLEAAKREVPRIIRDLNIKPEEQHLRLYQQLLQWYGRCGEQVMAIEFGSMGVPSEDELRRFIDRLRVDRARRSNR